MKAELWQIFESNWKQVLQTSISPSTKSDDDSPLVASKALTNSGVAGSAGAAPSVTARTGPSDAKSAGSTRSMLLASNPSAVTMSSWTPESTSQPKSGFGGIERLGS